MTPYAEKLQDPRWQKKRLEILERDGFKCKACETETHTLHVHHRKYHSEPWDAPNDELETVCKGCHWAIEDIFKAIRTADVKILRQLDDALSAYNATNRNKRKRRAAEIWIEATYRELDKSAKVAIGRTKA